MKKTIACQLLVILLIASASVKGHERKTTDQADAKPASTVQRGRFLGRTWQYPQMKGGITELLDVFNADGLYLDTVMLAMAQPHQASRWLELTGAYKRTYIPPDQDTQILLKPVDPKNPRHQDEAGGYLCTFEIESRKPVPPNEKQIEWEMERIRESVAKALGTGWTQITVQVFEKPRKEKPSAGPSYVVSATPPPPAKAAPDAKTRLVLYLFPLGQVYAAAPKVIPMGQSTQYELHMPCVIWTRLRAYDSIDARSVMDRIRGALDARWVTVKNLWLRAWTSGQWPDRNQPVVLVDMRATSEPKSAEQRKWHFVIKLDDGTLCALPKEKRDDRAGTGVLRPGYIKRVGVDIRHWKVPDRNHPGQSLDLIDAPWVKFVRVGLCFDDEAEQATTTGTRRNILFSHPIPVWPVGANPSKPEVSQETIAAASPVRDAVMHLGYGVGMQADAAPPHWSGLVRSIRILVVRRKWSAQRRGVKNARDVNFHLWLTTKDYNGKPLEADLEKGAKPAVLLMKSDDALLFVHEGQRPAKENWKQLLEALKKIGFQSVQERVPDLSGQR